MYDAEGESAFVQACREALQGRTIILITHRPASLALADRAIAVEEGAVSEISTDGKADLPRSSSQARNEGSPEIAGEGGLTDLSSKRFLPSDQAIESRVGDETVILHLENGAYYCLDQMGTQIWGLLKEGLGAAAIEERLAAEFGAPPEVIEKDLSRFLSDLRARGIVADA